jgi:diadenosine tetraphosphate (Ap4A) HIT family hydrolase
MAGITETKEVIKFVQVLAETITEAKADGSIDIFDAMNAISLISPLAAAGKGILEIKEELKDLDKEEVQELLAIMQDAVSQLVQALK